MASFLKLQPRLRAPTTVAYLSRPVSNASSRRTYAQKTSKPQGKEGTTKTRQQETDAMGNQPIPSNKAQPTLRDEKQSPTADEEGNLRDDLPQDVKQHNEEMDERYDKPFNRLANGGAEPAWERK